MSSVPSSLYLCFLDDCTETFVKKSNWKTHALRIHINPDLYRCDGCNAPFDTSSRARNHCRFCPQNGDPNAYERRLEGRSCYASAYSDACFKTEHQLADHLMPLCEKGRVTVFKDPNRKLKNLLKYEAYHMITETISSMLLGRSNAWTELSWPPDVAHKASIELERAVKPGSPEAELTLFANIHQLIVDGAKHSGLSFALSSVEHHSRPSIAFTGAFASYGCSPSAATSNQQADMENRAALEFNYGPGGAHGIQREEITGPLVDQLTPSSGDIIYQQRQVQPYSLTSTPECGPTYLHPNHVSTFPVENSTTELYDAVSSAQHWIGLQHLAAERKVSLLPPLTPWNSYDSSHFDPSEPVPAQQTYETYESDTRSAEDLNR